MHCQYYYLAASLPGPPGIRVFANLPQILENTIRFEHLNKFTSFEASCYTDPLSLEHITGGLEETIKFIANRPNSHLRCVTNFDTVTSLLSIEHNGNIRVRSSLNPDILARRLEGGTPNINARITTLPKMAMPKVLGGGGYPIGIVLAPIIPVPDWQIHYAKLLDDIKHSLDFDGDLTIGLITHRFTPGSKDVLMEWYPNISLEMNEDNRSIKRNKFGDKIFLKQG